MLTDITYIYFGNGLKAYLSAVKDCATNVIVSYHVSSNLTIDIVMNSLAKLKFNLGKEALKDTLIHSDQGFHYTNPLYQEKVKDLGMIQSMSRRGNCWDNAPMESFFGHFKDEVDFKNCKTLEDLKIVVANHIHHYNNC